MGVSVPDGRIEQFLTEDRSLSPFVPTLCAREPLTNILRPRNFAILLFGRDVQRHIPGAFSLFSVYPGTDRSDRHAERYEIAGTVLEQAARLTQLVGAQVSTAFDKEDLAAPNALKYPDRALYEAMGNALAHRDYELFDPVRITAFADRIEVLSPGALPLGVDPAAFRQGRAAPKWRNQTLAWFFNRLLLAQAEGQGLTTIQQTMQREGCPPPVFEPASGHVVCILSAHPRHVLLRDIQEGRVALARGDLAAARYYVHRAVEKDPLDPQVLEIFTALQRSARDPKPILELVQSHLTPVLTLPSATLLDFAGTSLPRSN
jgi:ATP-dependent DNA helicase RecG